MSLTIQSPKASSGNRLGRKTYARTPTILELPRLTEVQLNSFDWFQTTGLKELLEEISPIVSFNKNLELHFGEFRFDVASTWQNIAKKRVVSGTSRIQRRCG